MLFSRVYNWIKYKTLSPSVLFANRLFVERDSKHRRVTSNLGLTFRNSKWSSYARTDTNLTSRSNYTTLISRLFAVTVVVLTAVCFTTLYDKNLLPTGIFTLVWFLFDADLYTKALFSSSMLCTLQIIVPNLQLRLLSTFSSTADIIPLRSSYPTPVFLTKRMHKPVLYGWLTQNFKGENFDDENVTNMLNDSIHNAQTLNIFNLLSSLYSSVRLIRRFDDSTQQLSRILEKLEDSELSSVKSYVSLELSHSISKSLPQAYVLDYLLYGIRKESHKDYFSECFSWTLAELQSEPKRYRDSMNNSSGLFYVPELSHVDLNLINTWVKELGAVRTSVENQLSIIRWQRWLYKYNVLHRSILRNTQHITSAKGLLNSGFFSSSIVTQNILTNFPQKYLPKVPFGWPAVVRGTYSTLYGNYTGLSNVTAKSLRSGHFFYNNPTGGSLSHYDLSYYWFTQRFYQLNTLYSNSAVSSTSSLKLKTDFTLRGRIYADKCDPSNRKPASTILDNVYLGYYDSTLFNKSMTEQIINMAKTRVGKTIPFYLPTEIHVDIQPSLDFAWPLSIYLIELDSMRPMSRDVMN